MRAFDVHHHQPTGGPPEELFRVPPRDEFERWIAGASPLDDAEVVVALHPPSYYVLTAGIADTRRLNDLVHAVALARPATTVAVGTVEPHHGDAALLEIDRLGGELGFAAIAWRARAQGVFADAPMMTTFVARAADAGLVPMLHASARSGNEKLWRIWRLVEQFPSVTFVLLGALSEWDQLQAILAQPERAKNCLYDLAHLHGEPEQIEMLAARLGVERLIFGTGAHCDPVSSTTLSPGQIGASSLADALKRAVLWDNAARLFAVKEPAP